MNLKTHTAYPEIQVNPDSFHWSLKLYNAEGGVEYSELGEAESRKDAIEKATLSVERESDAFLRPAEGDE